MLESWTTSEFYDYQILGAIGCVLKLYGRIDAEKLLRATNYLANPQAEDIRRAAADLQDVLLHGAILANDTGFGKTKQSLLVACMHTILYDAPRPGEASKQDYKPTLLVAPLTLINQWLLEMRDCWPSLQVVVSFSQHDYRESMALSSIPPQVMKEYPRLDALPANLKYVFDTSDVKATSTVIITSYETHMARTATKKMRNVPGVHFDPPQFDNEDQPIWQTPPKKEVPWATNQKGVYGLLIADEAQRIKNIDTGSWAVLYSQSF